MNRRALILKLKREDTFLKRWLIVMGVISFLVLLIGVVFVIPIILIDRTNYEWVGVVIFFLGITALVAAFTD
jgi:hypothetical protein